MVCTPCAEAGAHRMHHGCLHAIRQLAKGSHGRRERRSVPELAPQWDGRITKTIQTKTIRPTQACTTPPQHRVCSFSRERAARGPARGARYAPHTECRVCDSQRADSDRRLRTRARERGERFTPGNKVKEQQTARGQVGLAPHCIKYRPINKVYFDSGLLGYSSLAMLEPSPESSRQRSHGVHGL